jgi:hypothetical protein
MLRVCIGLVVESRCCVRSGGLTSNANAEPRLLREAAAWPDFYDYSGIKPVL